MSEKLDEKLDQYLADSYRDYDNIIPLMARYAELLTASNAKIMAHYAPLIQEVCLKWETEYPVIKGIRMFSLGLTNYFSAKFHEAMLPCEQAMEILKNSTYTDLFCIDQYDLWWKQQKSGRI